MIFNRWQKHSSEREIIYVNSNIFDYGAKYFSNIAHEFIHMLTWNYDYSPEPVNNPEIYWEQTWINEAWANFGTSYFNYDIISFGPEITYVNYPEISFFNYVLSENLLFFYYLFDNYGEWDFNSALLENQLNGMEGVESTLNGLGYNKTFDDFFEDFSIAEYINDTNYADGLFSYKSINVTSCFKSKETGCSMAMLGDYEGQLASYAKDYFLFDLQVQDPFPIQFKGDENSKFRLAFIMANKDKKIVEIKSIMPDDANNAIVTKDLMTEECDILIMIVINADRSLKDDELVSFSYNTPESTTIYDKTTYGEVSVYPNPVLQDLTIYLAGRYSHASFELFNMQGRKILSKTIIKSEKIDLQALNNGIFFYNVFTDKKIQCGKLIKQ
ncbi:MAG: T9SS type A sorting domain-containing protein [Prolixibacteraceae bacterium]|nr:T9SS type A sorting domain-containing protein [Prolixibacteraceae bacterium]